MRNSGNSAIYKNRKKKKSCIRRGNGSESRNNKPRKRRSEDWIKDK